MRVHLRSCTASCKIYEVSATRSGDGDDDEYMGKREAVDLPPLQVKKTEEQSSRMRFRWANKMFEYERGAWYTQEHSTYASELRLLGSLQPVVVLRQLGLNLLLPCFERRDPLSQHGEHLWTDKARKCDIQADE